MWDYFLFWSTSRNFMRLIHSNTIEKIMQFPLCFWLVIARQIQTPFRMMFVFARLQFLSLATSQLCFRLAVHHDYLSIRIEISYCIYAGQCVSLSAIFPHRLYYSYELFQQWAQWIIVSYLRDGNEAGVLDKGCTDMDYEHMYLQCLHYIKGVRVCHRMLSIQYWAMILT